MGTGLAAALAAQEKAKLRQVEVKTRRSGREYAARILDGNDRLIAAYMLVLTEAGMVWIYTADYSVGLYRLERFGGVLSPNSIRQFYSSAVTAVNLKG